MVGWWSDQADQTASAQRFTASTWAARPEAAWTSRMVTSPGNWGGSSLAKSWPALTSARMASVASAEGAVAFEDETKPGQMNGDGLPGAA